MGCFKSRTSPYAREDINDDTRTNVLVIDALLARCIARLTAAIQRDGLPGFGGMQAGHICEMLSSMKWTHNSIRELLRLEVHPSSVDALALVRVQLEGLYSVCYMIEKPGSVDDYVKSAWKKAYCRFLLDREEHIHLPRFREFYETRADRNINSLQAASGVTGEERATIDLEELGRCRPE